MIHTNILITAFRVDYGSGSAMPNRSASVDSGC